MSLLTNFQRCYGGVFLLDGAGPSLRNIERLDHNAAPMIAHMMRDGMRVDLDHFKRMETSLSRDMDQITETVRKLTGYYVNLDSGDQVSDLLFRKLGLKQAHPKLTNSGDRESVADQVLTAIQHEHPVVPQIQDFKELSKLRGTYAIPIQDLAVKVGPDNWRLFPSINQNRVPSGRLAAKNPNVLAIPSRTRRGREIRKGFIPSKGRVMLSSDLCLHPDTMIWTLKGKIPIRDVKPGDMVLSFNEGRITYGKVTASRSRPSKRASELTFDNNEKVIASFDHRWPIKTRRKKKGQYEVIVKKTDELDLGERMVPCREGKTGVPGRERKTWYSRSSFEYEYQHILVAKAVLGPRPEGCDVHHKNEDYTDNHPDNLEYKDSFTHRSEHGKSHYKKQDHTLRVANLREALKTRRSYSGEGNPNSRLTDGDRESINELFSQGYKPRHIAKAFNISRNYACELSGNFKRGIRSRKIIEDNHRLINKQDMGIQPMWAITVEPHHNYVLACGVVTMNSQIEPRISTHRSMDPGLVSIYEHGEDIYSDFAIAAFKLKDERYYDEKARKWKYPGVDPMRHRRHCKICILAAFYDVTAKGLLEQMPVVCARCMMEATQHTCEHEWEGLEVAECARCGLKEDQTVCNRYKSYWTEELCQDILNSFYLKYVGVLKMRSADHKLVRAKAMLWDIWGRILHVGAVRSVLTWVVSSALREAGNFPIQSSASGVIKLAMAQLHNEFEAHHVYDSCSILLQIHDELLFDVDRHYASDIAAHIQDRMESVVRLRIPVKAGASTAESWGLLEK